MDGMSVIRRDRLLVISAVLAIIALFIVPFETVMEFRYQGILETICTLLFFLLIVAGLKECNFLNKLAQKAITNIRTTRNLCMVLIALPFFSAMLFSNDVALLTFVPLAIMILSMADLKKLIIAVVILQTVAANVGSFLTPFGNPHNLYIFNLDSVYNFSLLDYEMALIPIVVVGAIALFCMTMMIENRPLEIHMDEPTELQNKKVIAVIGVLFVLAIITVLDFIPVYITLIVVVVAFLIMMPRIFTKVNYSILFVFFFLFVFANGMANLELVRDTISDLMDWDPMLTTVIVSQFTSNVPAPILLQPFTNDWAALLVGADIGGFGTPIASMASVITIKLYLQEKDSSAMEFFKVFFAVNIVMVAVLVPTYYLFHRGHLLFGL